MSESTHHVTPIDLDSAGQSAPETPEQRLERTIAVTVLGVTGVHRLGTGAARVVGAVRNAVGSADSAGVRATTTDTGLAVDVSVVAEYPTNVTELADTIRTQVRHAVGQLDGEPVTIDVTVTDVHGPFDEADAAKAAADAEKKEQRERAIAEKKAQAKKALDSAGAKASETADKAKAGASDALENGKKGASDALETTKTVAADVVDTAKSKTADALDGIADAVDDEQGRRDAGRPDAAGDADVAADADAAADAAEDDARRARDAADDAERADDVSETTTAAAPSAAQAAADAAQAAADAAQAAADVAADAAAAEAARDENGQAR